MSCCFPSQPSSASQIEDHSCWQKQSTKVALFVISLLCAGGAVASHFTVLGVPGIIAFSVASGASMAIFVAVCIYSSCNEIRPQFLSAGLNQNIANRGVADNQSEKLLKRKEEICRMSDTDLLENMLLNGKTDQLIIDALSSKIGYLFNPYPHEVNIFAQRLQPFFSVETVALENFPLFVELVANSSGYNLKFITAVLEQVEWPISREKREEILVQGLGRAILTSDLRSRQELNVKENEYSVHQLVIMPKNIFGKLGRQPPSSDLLFSAIGRAIALKAEMILKNSQETQKSGAIGKETKSGLEVVIKQNKNYRLPASILGSILPHLTNIPGLVGLVLSDVGISSPLEYIEGKATEGHGFRDKDVEALLEVLTTNPCLTNIRICIDGMSKAGAQRFLEQWGEIEKQKADNKPLSIEQVLSSTAADTTAAPVILTKKTNSSSTGIAAPAQDNYIVVRDMSNDELLQKMDPMSDAIGNEQLIRDELGDRICVLFKTHIKSSDEILTQALRDSFFSTQELIPETFELLATLVAENSGSRFLTSTACILEQLEWPDEGRKQEDLLISLAHGIMKNFFPEAKSSVYFRSSRSSNRVNTRKLFVETKHIFGYRDFTKNPIPIPDIIFQAFGHAIRLSAKMLLEELQQEDREGLIDQNSEIGLEVEIGQFNECRFPASMIAPVLPYLTNIPGLVGLELSDIGISSPLEYVQGKATEGHGFRDEDIEALLEVLRTNPYLTKVRICIDGMSEAGADRFIEQWGEIEREKMENEPLCIEKALALCAANTTTKDDI